MIARHRHGIRAALIVTLLLATCVPATVAAASELAIADCHQVQVSVALTPNGPANIRLSGQVCYPTDPATAIPGAIQVLVSGLTYGQSYWDFPYQPDTYSYVQSATRAGFTTFNFDRIGIGQSTHPASTQVSIPSNAYTIHQAIQQLRAATLDGTQYSKVVIVGHSLGSLISWYEAGTYHDVDAVVASGILHSFNDLGVAQLVTTLYPAALDPRFLGRITDPGYLTTLPGTRENSFYYPPATDPAVAQMDEASKETGTVPEATGVFAMELPGVLRPLSQVVCAATPGLCGGVASSIIYGVTRNITVPVLNVVGQYDALLCGGADPGNQCANVGGVKQAESAYYTGATQQCLTLAELADAGHDVNLEPTAPNWFALANDWSQFTLSHGSGTCWSGTARAGLLLP